MITVKNITKRYDKQLALDDVSFEIQSGEVVGFLGRNGAGKSTMMKIITGYLPPSHGQVWVDRFLQGQDSIEAKRQIGYLPEHNPLYSEMYVREYLTHVARLYKMHNIPRLVAQLVERVGLGREQHKLIAALSKGYRQRVGLAQALIHDPQVLILDEPTTGLDPNQIVEIRNLISELGRNKTIMLSTHIMQEVEAICNRVMIIHNGKMMFDGMTKDVVSGNYTTNQQRFFVEFTSNPSEVFWNRIPDIISKEKLDDFRWQIMAKSDIREIIFRQSVENNLSLRELYMDQHKMEKIFTDFTLK